MHHAAPELSLALNGSNPEYEDEEEESWSSCIFPDSSPKGSPKS